MRDDYATRHALTDDARDAIERLDAVLGGAIADDRPLDALAAIRHAGEVLTSRSQEAARVATDGAATWADIGSALGVSRQAAHQRLAAKLQVKREQLDDAERAGHEKILKKFAKAHAHLDRHAGDDARVAKLRAKVSDAEAARHDKLSRKVDAVREKLAEQERSLTDDA
jgi:hypothetical protein